MVAPNWQLKAPIQAIMFDCDGTLSAVEGIDELADKKKVGDDVRALTAQAMGKTGINPELYRKRLDLVRPDKKSVQALAETYFAHREPHVEEVIGIFKRLQKSVYIVSAGVNPAVQLFGEKLGVPVNHIYAVDLQFDEDGKYLDYDHTSPMTQANGKREIVQRVKKQHPRILHVGDGMNDMAVISDVTRFVGYGGSYYRQNIADQSEFYIKTKSLASLLPISLTADEARRLTLAEKMLYEKGMEDIKAARVLIKVI